MLQLVLTLALAAAPDKAPLSLNETAAKLNATLPEDQKILVPSQGSRVFLTKMDEFKAPSNSAQATKKVLEFSDLTLQGCNAFSWGAQDSIQLSEFSKAFKTAT